jgi:endonuclease YncB( thermonuclease family)
MMSRVAAAALWALPFLLAPAHAADLVHSHGQTSTNAGARNTTESFPVYRGRAAAIDGRTLWFPDKAAKVRLAGIDACELPQWALDPTWRERERIKAPGPVPCGPFAKAWLKRTIGSKTVSCRVIGSDVDGVPLAKCLAGGKDIALEMIRVGWARIVSGPVADPAYWSFQRYAMAARYGMWATYVLDMDEWRAKAVDRTLSRRPIADFNLLAERQSEISPPFADARKKPLRTDR